MIIAGVTVGICLYYKKPYKDIDFQAINDNLYEQAIGFSGFNTGYADGCFYTYNDEDKTIIQSDGQTQESASIAVPEDWETINQLGYFATVEDDLYYSAYVTEASGKNEMQVVCVSEKDEAETITAIEKEDIPKEEMALTLLYYITEDGICTFDVDGQAQNVCFTDWHGKEKAVATVGSSMLPIISQNEVTAISEGDSHRLIQVRLPEGNITDGNQIEKSGNLYRIGDTDYILTDKAVMVLEADGTWSTLDYAEELLSGVKHETRKGKEESAQMLPVLLRGMDNQYYFLLQRVCEGEYTKFGLIEFDLENRQLGMQLQFDEEIPDTGCFVYTVYHDNFMVYNDKNQVVNQMAISDATYGTVTIPDSMQYFDDCMEQYMNDEINYETFMSNVEDYDSNNAIGYFQLLDSVNDVKDYQDQYHDIKTLYDEKQYYEAYVNALGEIQKIKNEQNPVSKKLQTIRDNCYSEAKQYYMDLAGEAYKSGDFDVYDGYMEILNNMYVNDDQISEEIAVFEDSLAPKSVSYTTTKDDRSGVLDYGEGYNRVRYDNYYERVVVDSSYRYADEINAYIKTKSDQFFSEETNNFMEYVEEYATKETSPLGNDVEFSNNLTLLGVYNDNGILSIRLCRDWMVGGVGDGSIYSYTFRLKDGKAITLPELLGKSEAETKQMVENAVYAKIDQVPGAFESDAKSIVSQCSASDYKYFVDEQGDVYVTFYRYEISQSAAISVCIN